jgi:hypothetical protein
MTKKLLADEITCDNKLLTVEMFINNPVIQDLGWWGGLCVVSRNQRWAFMPPGHHLMVDLMTFLSAVDFQTSSQSRRNCIRRNLSQLFFKKKQRNGDQEFGD